MWQFVCLLLGCLATTVIGSSSNVGTNFSVPIPPNHLGSTDGQCRLVFTTTGTSSVLVGVTPRRTGVLQTVVVEPDTGGTWDLDCAERVTDGVEDQAVRVLVLTPDTDITVRYFSRNGPNADSFTMFPVEEVEETRRYVLQSVDNNCDGAAIDAFYTMSAYYDDTTVTVYDSVRSDANIVEQTTLNIQQTFTRSYQCDDNADFSGYIIESSKPLTVVSGSLRIALDCEDPDYGYFQALDMGFVSDEYITPALPLLNEGPLSTYYVRIIALEDNTIATVIDQNNIPLVAKEMVEGELAQYTVNNGAEAHIVRCSRNCVVHAFNRHACNNADLVFMFHLPAIEQGATIGWFRGVENFPSRISVVSNTQNIQLNNVPIGRNTSWVEMQGNDLYYATIIKNPEDGTAQTLEVVGEGAFQAYVYGVVQQRVGYGDIFAIGDTPLKSAEVLPES